MPSLLSLPKEIQIIICQNLTLSCVLTFRLVHSSIAAVVFEHSQSIAPSVAAVTFPDAKLLLRAPSGQGHDFKWLTSLVYKYLAAVLVDRFKLSSTQHFFESLYIPAESEIGENLRARVENGWHIFNDLGNLTKDAQDPRHQCRARVSSIDIIRHGAISHRRRDELVKMKTVEEFEQRVKIYLHGLSLRSIEDYRITEFLLQNAFRTKHDRPEARLMPTHFKTYDGPDDFDWSVRQGVTVEKRNSWVNFAILQLGPAAFYKQWCLTSDYIDPMYIRRRLNQLWETTTLERIEMQKHIALIIADTIRARYESNALWRALSEEFDKYKAWELGLQRFHSGDPLPRDWMNEVPYYIDFKVIDTV